MWIYNAALGVSYWEEPSTSFIKIVLSINAKDEWTELNFNIISGNYPKERLSVDPSKIHFTKEDEEKIGKENELVFKIYNNPDTTKHWRNKFNLPMKSKITSRFGNSRLFNGESKSYHSGVDFRARIGSKIRAPAPGIVVLSKDLFFSGSTVIIDHGFGIFTSYGHLSKYAVKEGQKVDSLAIIGYSGKTGRVSGPHLHWGATVQGTKVDPLHLTTRLR